MLDASASAFRVAIDLRDIMLEFAGGLYRLQIAVFQSLPAPVGIEVSLKGVETLL